MEYSLTIVEDAGVACSCQPSPYPPTLLLLATGREEGREEVGVEHRADIEWVGHWLLFKSKLKFLLIVLGTEDASQGGD